MSSIDISTVNAFLSKSYRHGYQDTNLVIPPVALPVGSYRMERSDEHVDGAIFIGAARLTPVPDIDAGGNRDDLLKITAPNAFAFAPYSDSQFFVASIAEEDGELGEDGIHDDVINIYNDSVGCD